MKLIVWCSTFQIFRIQNPFLLNRYISRNREMSAKYAAYGETVKQMLLFHGTPKKEQQVLSICETNFDWRRSGENKGQRHGQATYFSSKMTHAYHYSEPDNAGIRVMFVAKVLVGLMTMGNISTRIPPVWKGNTRYDTTVDDLSNPTIFAKYDNNECYPAYLIEFSNK